MHKAVSAVVATAIVASAVGAVAVTSASAGISVPDGKECTRVEYGKIQKGDSKDAVDRIIGSNGLLSYGGADSTGFVYAAVSYGSIVTAGCRISSSKATVTSRWSPKTAGSADPEAVTRTGSPSDASYLRYDSFGDEPRGSILGALFE
jgi:hypothetical protein